MSIYFASQASPLTRRPCMCDAYRFPHRRCRKCDDFSEPPIDKWAERDNRGDYENQERWDEGRT